MNILKRKRYEYGRKLEILDLKADIALLRSDVNICKIKMKNEKCALVSIFITTALITVGLLSKLFNASKEALAFKIFVAISMTCFIITRIVICIKLRKKIKSSLLQLKEKQDELERNLFRK